MITGGLFTYDFVPAFGWMLVHSFWQGGLIALLTGFCLYLTRGKSAALHYRLLLISLFTFTIINLSTFLLYYTGSKSILPENPDQVFSLLPFSGDMNIENPALLNSFTTYINQTASWIVFTWFVFFCYRLTIYVLGWRQAQQMRRQQLYSIPEEWQLRFEQLVQQMNIKKKVQLFESAMMKVPVTIGFLKPVILLPLGILSNLPPVQIEAVLRHELAHICRHDYVINIIQLFLDALYFFNPSFVWLSDQLREKREYCCDDIAIQDMNNREEFAIALVAFKKYTLQKSVPVVAFTKHPLQLRYRILRILGQPANTASISFSSLLCALSTVLAIAFFSYNDTNRSKENTIAETVKTIPEANSIDVYIPKDTTVLAVRNIPPAKPTIKEQLTSTIEMDSAMLSRLTGEFNTTYQNTHYIIGVAKSRMTRLIVNGEDILPEHWSEYDQAFAAIVAEFKEHQQKTETSSNKQQDVSNAEPVRG
ncbi:M56 family metallopeptidase [Gynurincola endophyticus]|uniref:M56 family metallopeptidase n=1 Tax=Gynurincola endophyticus TaxID=2479004 RepID=UPI000F8EB9F7|nr:M56 family metallopeptidase [Gynurincola endophyticus]